MFLRSLVLSVSLAAAVATSAQAGWFSKEKPRTEEAEQTQESKHEHHEVAATKTTKVKAKSTSAAGAYRAAMHRMHGAMKKPLSGSADIDFVRQMIPHHQGALDMARIQQKYGRDAELKKFNDWVIMAQTQEIAFMQNWLRRKDRGAVCKKGEDYYGEAMKNMHHAMMIKYTGNADVDYVHGMIAHHQGAVDMAGAWLEEGSDPELRTLVHDIYNAQTQEIAWMQRWLEGRGYAAH
jgi:uncharacterized protein (DUF305 family)